jgi:uncharacterized integral membrane protein
VKEKLKIGAAIAALAVLLLFIVFNLDKVIVNFLIARVEAPLFLVIIISAVLGAVGAFAVRVLMPRPKKKEP